MGEPEFLARRRAGVRTAGVSGPLRTLGNPHHNPRATRAAVDEWAARWQLTPVDPIADHWPRDVALATLAHWWESPEIIERVGLRWRVPSQGVALAFTGAEEAAYTRARRGKRDRARFHALAAARDFEATPILRERAAFRWLALYQVAEEWSLTDLSTATERLRELRRLGLTPVTRRALQRALHRTAALIGLRLRPPGRAGRPPTHIG